MLNIAHPNHIYKNIIHFTGSLYKRKYSVQIRKPFLHHSILNKSFRNL